MAELTTSNSASPKPSGRSEWHYAPDLPIGNNPLFEFPWNLKRMVEYYRDYWLTISEATIFAALAVGGWMLLKNTLGDMSVLSLGWILPVYGLNLGLVVLFAGGFHLFFYSMRRQGDELKYVPQFLHRGGGRFTFGRQVLDNMFWSLASGVTVMTAYVVLLFWLNASNAIPSITFSGSPFLFVAIMFCTGIWVAFHFYWGHRLLHVGLLYKWVHSLHHRNVNVGPWSGISMHPVEHLVYFSSMLIHLVVPSHPVLILFHANMLALSAIFGHTGFDQLLIGKSRRIALGHFHHQLHHRYFECNYGSVDMPLDIWFGTFHDGSPEARRRLKARLGPR